MRRIWTAMALVALVALLAGCSGTEDNPPDTTTAPTTSPGPALGPSPGEVSDITRETAYAICSNDPDQVYAEAGTTDPLGAAEWYGEGIVPQHRQTAVEACLAGLRGEPSP